jgi:predicted RNA binding protein YcfA (HicA-like mRNA interferase family)
VPSKVPRVTGQDAVRAFGKVGFRLDRVQGSHYILKHPDKTARLSIPVHAGRTVGIGLLSAQIKAAGLSVAEFTRLL